MTPSIYIFFKGDCLEAMHFYAETLGGEITGVFRNADAPDAASRMPGGDDLVLNMAMTLDGHTIMASDCPPEWYRPRQGFAISINPSSATDFDRIFVALAEGAETISMPPGETFWAERFAMLTDQFGTPWMLNYTGSKAPQAKGA